MSEDLLHLISANPDDDTARLVYADWLDERDDTARAEFIRLQCARAKLPLWDPEHLRLQLRERALLAEHEVRWRASLPEIEGVTWGGFHRGFVWRAAFASADALRTHAAACQAATPLESVALRWPSRSEWATIDRSLGLRELTLYGTLYRKTDADGLAYSRLLSTLRSLNIVESRMDRPTFRRLLASSHLEKLEALRMPHHLVDSLADLVKAKSLPALETLDLSVATADELGSGGRDAKTVSAADMEALASWPGLAKIRSLDLSGNKIGGYGLLTLLSSPHAVGLKELHIREIVDEEEETLSFEAFRAARPGLSLDVLSLQNTFDIEDVKLLADAPCLSQLKVLRLQQMSAIGAKAYKLLATAPWFDSLRMLHVEDGDASALLKALPSRAPARLHSLKLHNCLSWSKSRDSDVAAFVASPASNTLLTLDLSFNRLGDTTITALCETTGLQLLLSLILDGPKGASDAVAERLAQSPLGMRLMCLALGRKDDRLPLPFPIRLEHRAYSGPLSDL